MAHWLPAAILALFCFGLWGLFSKLSLFYLDAKSALIYQSLGVFIIAFFILNNLSFKVAVSYKGIIFGLLTGLAYGVGCLFYLFAADKGKLTTVVTLTALYPIITILFSSFILQETITVKQCLGIILALLAIFLLSA